MGRTQKQKKIAYENASQYFIKEQWRKIIEWFGLEETLKITLFQPPGPPSTRMMILPVN